MTNIKEEAENNSTINNNDNTPIETSENINNLSPKISKNNTTQENFEKSSGYSENSQSSKNNNNNLLPSNSQSMYPSENSLADMSTDSTTNLTSSNSYNDEVRTLFVSGLPMDVKQRELYLLFRTYEGYQGNIIRMTSKAGKPPAPVGFVTFNSRREADKARISLQGVKFDPFDQMPLRLEFARSNTKARLRPASPNGNNVSNFMGSMSNMSNLNGGIINGNMVVNNGINAGLGNMVVNNGLSNGLGTAVGTVGTANLVSAVPAHTIIGRQIGDYFGAQLVAQAQANAQNNHSSPNENNNSNENNSNQQQQPISTSSPQVQSVSTENSEKCDKNCDF